MKRLVGRKTAQVEKISVFSLWYCLTRVSVTSNVHLCWVVISHLLQLLTSKGRATWPVNCQNVRCHFDIILSAEQWWAMWHRCQRATSNCWWTSSVAVLTLLTDMLAVCQWCRHVGRQWQAVPYWLMSSLSTNIVSRRNAVARPLPMSSAVLLFLSYSPADSKSVQSSGDIIHYIYFITDFKIIQIWQTLHLVTWVM